MKKYLRLSCSTCHRTVDKLVDLTHYAPDQCTITLRCPGRLFPIQYRSDGGITASQIAGVQDWRPRGTTASSATAETIQFLNLRTGTVGAEQLGQLVIAADLAAPPAPGSVLNVKLIQRADAPKAYKQFIYRIEGMFSSVGGIESGLEKKVLRYSTTDTVQVFLNGVKLQNGVAPNDYQLYNGAINGVPPNTVNFNTPISLSGVTQVDVIVSPTVPETEVTLPFTLNAYDESRQSLGAWEDVQSVLAVRSGAWRTMYLFTLDLENAALSLNTVYTAAPTASLGATLVPISSLMFVVSRAPYSVLDRYTNIVVPFSSLEFERDYLKYSVSEGIPTMQCTTTAAEEVYPPLRVQLHSGLERKTIQTPVAGVQDQIVLENRVIIGPDA